MFWPKFFFWQIFIGKIFYLKLLESKLPPRGIYCQKTKFCVVKNSKGCRMCESEHPTVPKPHRIIRFNLRPNLKSIIKVYSVRKYLCQNIISIFFDQNLDFCVYLQNFSHAVSVLSWANPISSGFDETMILLS